MIVIFCLLGGEDRLLSIGSNRDSDRDLIRFAAFVDPPSGTRCNLYIRCKYSTDRWFGALILLRADLPNGQLHHYQKNFAPGGMALGSSTTELSTITVGAEVCDPSKVRQLR